jgi:hypothetical protein
LAIIVQGTILRCHSIADNRKKAGIYLDKSFNQCDNQPINHSESTYETKFSWESSRAKLKPFLSFLDYSLRFANIKYFSWHAITFMTYLKTSNGFLDEWAERWCSLVDLLFETIRTDKPAGATLKPGIIEERLYQNLRSWFTENEARFLPLWKSYYKLQDWNLNTSQDIIQEIQDADKCLENPFIAFYMLESLDKLLHCISGSSERYPTDKQAWDTAMDLLRLDSLAFLFVTGQTWGATL